MRKSMQKDIFIKGEGDSWFERNKYKREIRFARYKEHVVEKINSIRNGKRYSILEIGCSYGWGVNMLNEMCDAYGCGIDPSLKAIEYGCRLYKDINLIQGTADSLPFNDNEFDVIIFGFCLDVCDQEDLFKIASEANRVLKSDGFIFLIEFDSVGIPYYNEYEHKKGIKCIKMNFSDMFLWHPSYSLLYKNIFNEGYNLDPDKREAIFMLSKKNSSSFIKNPF